MNEPKLFRYKVSRYKTMFYYIDKENWFPGDLRIKYREDVMPLRIDKYYKI